MGTLPTASRLTKLTGVAILCMVMLSVALYLLAFGGAIACCTRVAIGKSAITAERVFHTLVPTGLATMLLVFAFRLSRRMFTRRRNAWLVGCLALCVAVFVDLAVFWNLRESGDDRLRLAWESDAGTFSWGSGQVRLPAGLTHHEENGIDTLVGHFTSPDGGLLISYDIGELAGEHGGAGKEEAMINGSRVKIARGTQPDEQGQTKILGKVSFPDSGCANFLVTATSQHHAEAIDTIARSFQPLNEAPSWLRPLLPELLRSDCRYRWQSPFDP